MTDYPAAQNLRILGFSGRTQAYTVTQGNPFLDRSPDEVFGLIPVPQWQGQHLRHWEVALTRSLDTHQGTWHSSTQFLSAQRLLGIPTWQVGTVCPGVRVSRGQDSRVGTLLITKGRSPSAVSTDPYSYPHLLTKALSLSPMDVISSLPEPPPLE